MGEKTTIEIENMRELKQHALDTSKTLKQIINEAIIEKINKERGEMNLPPLKNFTSDRTREAADGDATNKKSGTDIESQNEVDPQILSIVIKFLNAHDLDWAKLSKDQWNDRIEGELMDTIENVYDESLAHQTIEMIRKKIKF